MSSLEIRHVNKSYGTFKALNDINLVVEQGEFLVLVGPSGCGKSTLLKAIAGLETVDDGTMLIGGRDVTKEEPSDRGIAMVFQSYALYPHMSVAENMGFGLRMAKRPKAEIDAAVRHAADILRLTSQLDKLPKQLSGGQRQRVAIGRAITRSPEVFLFDEPLSNLDAALRTQMRVELAGLHAELGATMVYVTHDQVEAMTMANRIVVLNNGRIEQVGKPTELYAAPQNRFVAGFLGSPRMNFFSATLDADKSMLSLAGMAPFARKFAQKPIGGDVTIGIRPEAFHLETSSPTALRVKAEVRLVEQLGKETILYVNAAPLCTVFSDTGTQDIAVHVPEACSHEAGASVEICFEPNDVYVFAGPDELTQR